MTKRMSLPLIIITGLMSYATAAFAGAWTLDEGKGDLIVTTTAISATFNTLPDFVLSMSFTEVDICA